MSVAQGTSSLNTAYFSSMITHAQKANSCSALQSIHTKVNASVNGTLAAVSSQITAIQTQVNQLADDISALTGHIATLSASQSAMAAVGTVSLTATAAVDLSTALAYIHAQGLVLSTLSTTNTASFAAQAIALAKELIKIENDYTLLTNKISTLDAQLTAIPTQLAALNSAITTAAARFPSCVI